MKAINLCLFCLLLIGCANKPKQEKVPQTLINNTVGINDTLGLSLHPEFPIYSTKQKQVTFILHNNSGTDIGFGGYYSYTYEDEKGIWRDIPMQLVVFDEEIILWQGNKYYYNAELFRHTPGRYRFFLTVRRYSKEYTLMTEFQLQDNMIELFKRHPYSQLNDTLLPSEEAVYPPIYNVIDQMPEFPGGMDKLLQFINDNMKYPTKAQTEGIQGRVAVQFIVDENGYIIEPNIVRSVEPSLDNEALRLIKMLPQWKPGTLKGKAVKVKYTVPVAFKLK
ncbi:Gram-negative bacterial TonB protein C-terminal [Bacteroides finegoldii]|jgi:tonB family C-terminal domain|uniref:TonB family domain-containing protein n=1 Tax=Bacteroides finegoldii CL09T03C10 TaxID=997888 RepID=K5CQF7_9BACE|nr:energy transducer TonB [Bacteroides finegoldii]EKJ92056.1 TonB family domain-containing protein [Bacteroides finegoldii CL09T03C10]